MARHPGPRATNKKPRSDSDADEYLAQAFSDIELLAAADVIRAAITQGKKHVDLEALKEVLDKLTSAYNWRKQVAR
jgi:flagellar hook-basal body complex protein FliE